MNYIKKYQLTDVDGKARCLKSGVMVEAMEPGVYVLKQMTDGPHTISYMGSGVVRIPLSQVRKLEKKHNMKLEKIYVRFDGETLHLMEPPVTLKVMLDMGYHITTKEHLDEQEDLAPMELTDFFIENGVGSLVYMPGKVYVSEDGEDIYRDISCLKEDGLDLFMKIVKRVKGDEITFEPFMKPPPTKDE